MFTATVTDRTAESVIQLEGELDIATVPQLATVVHGMLNAGHTNITLDLSGLAFVDSSGLSGIVRLAQRALSAGGILQVRNPSPLTVRAIEITGIAVLVDLRP